MTKASKYTDTIIRVGIMKKIWKNVFVGAMIAGAMTGVVGCGKNTNNMVSVDLDGDGVISEWETVFQPMSASDRAVYKTVKSIGSFDELKAINGKDKDTAYVLTSNIDCNGETLAINIGPSNYLYGNNKIITNFKLGKATFSEDDDGSGLKSYLTTGPKASAYCLFYNAGAVYDLRIFMGNQSFAPNDQDTVFDASAFNSVQYVDNVIIKGAIKVKPHDDDQLKTYNLALGLVDHTNEKIEVGNIETIGMISYEDSNASRQCAEVVNVSGVIPNVEIGSVIYKANSKVDISVNTKGKVDVGQIASKSYGFISSCNASGNIKVLYNDYSTLTCGGVVGSCEQLSEVKNCTMTGKIDFASNVNFAIDYHKTSKAYVGGIVGKSNFAVINYVSNDAVINGNSLTTVVVGGICGEASNTIFSNIIARGSINLTNVNGIFIANVCGKMEYGLIDKAIAVTNINVNNSEYDLGVVKLGMVTIFEGGSVEEFEDLSGNTTYYYDMFSDDQKTPEFANILVGGTSAVYVKKNNAGTNGLEYELGLRNPFKYKTQGEQGDELTSYIPNMELFTGIYYLKDNYKLTYYESDNGQNSQVTLVSNFPAYGNKSVEEISSIQFSLAKNFVGYLGFSYGGSRSEVDFSGVGGQYPQDIVESFNTIKFTLKDDASIIGYFDESYYNGELSRFDKKFETPYSLGDENYNTADELFSFINYYIKFDVSNANNLYMPLLFNTKFFSETTINDGEETEAKETEVRSVGIFADKVAKCLGKMGCAVNIKYYALDGYECDASAENVTNVKIIASGYSGDVSHIYTFNFDVRNFMKTLDSTSSGEVVLIDENGSSYYLINLLYTQS